MKRRAGTLVIAAAAAIVAASAFALLPSSSSNKPGTAGRTPLFPTPTAITDTCAQAAVYAEFPVLCPARWPLPRGAPKARLFERAPGVYLIDAANGFRRRGGHVFHLLLGGQRQPFGRWPGGVDPDLRVTTRKVTIPTRDGGTFVQQLPARRIARAHVHGAPAAVLREPPYPAGGLHGGHVVVLWNEGRRGYLVSVHGERLSQRSLVSIALAMARSARRSR